MTAPESAIHYAQNWTIRYIVATADFLAALRVVVQYLLSACPGHTLQHLPGRRTGSGQSGAGHSDRMFLHLTRPTTRLFLWICNALLYSKVLVCTYKTPFILTGTHSQWTQGMMPKGGPRSGTHVSSRLNLRSPKRHSAEHEGGQ